MEVILCKLNPIIFDLFQCRMPYCEAAVLEGVRMFMGYTFGIPHRALRDTKFRGFDIPKVSQFMPTFNRCRN